MDTIALVRKFISEECDYDKPLTLQDDIFDHIRITGEDTVDFIREFSESFDVDMSSYLWYFHTEEEGIVNVGGSLFKSPDRMVSRIPITIQMLADSIKTKEWAIQYPDHQIPKVRKDFVANWIVLIMLPVVFLIWVYVR